MTEERKSLLEFPCSFSVKAMGLSHSEFDSRVVEIIRKHAPDIHEGAVSSRPSRQGKYTAVTVTIQATSQSQLDSIYQDLTRCEEILMAL